MRGTDTILVRELPLFRGVARAHFDALVSGALLLKLPSPAASSETGPR
jgi:hypothetical protein